MRLPQGLSLSVEVRPSEEDRETIDAALTEFNGPYLRDPAFGRIGIFLRDEARTVVAGLDASFYAGWDTRSSAFLIIRPMLNAFF